MNLNPEEIRKLREAFASLAGESGRRDDCPSASRLWDGASGVLSASETEDVVNHTSLCPTCAEAWRLASALVPDREPEQEILLEPGTKAASPSRRPSKGFVENRPFRNWILAAAATLVIAVAGIGVLKQFSPGRFTLPEPQLRTTRQEEIRSLVPEDHPLPRLACTLRWSEGPEGSRYHLRVATEDLTTVAEARNLERASYQIDSSLLEDLPSGTRLLWQIELLTPDGKVVSSRTFVNRLE